MDVLIVGAGEMGRWFGDAIATESSVAFTDVDAAAAEVAAEAVDGRAVSLETDERFEAVCLAVPMTAVEAAIEAHAHKSRTATLDVSGVMEPALEAMAAHAPDRERVSLHPLFAPERAPGSIAVVRDEPGPVSANILETLRERGNEMIETTATEHDEAMESVQAAAHTAVLSFALAAETVPEGFETPIYEGLRELAEQVTDGTPRVYADIQGAFDGADDVAAAAARIAEADPAEFESLYRDARDRWHAGDRE
ncbi:prephenate dehydrogenase/arogenate dehydrogenase family protein [Natrialbaceae archaeon AArc-T1-2]|uniref:prephenate dehydrogenase/arogenate dehydrogenase family protein n=1 Tax=Natrialbaceae archaeon AArc-T1-2 TaxID=3053904 RepID=UPI00255A96D8|nr:prephenate dehydrogenase/arogenate dehydrogenase family protein [Natrialbaceae archaeon AArc-T1-2]WIV66637.1 prephenate dehydrogenase/arogenate dehydrogenase family protein [Natrialbaceae archaeon AArc-T1-2]